MPIIGAADRVCQAVVVWRSPTTMSCDVSKPEKTEVRKKTEKTVETACALAHHDARRRPRPALVGGELLPHPAGDVPVDLGVRAVGLGDHDRMAAVGAHADVEMQRHLAEEGDAELFGFLARAAMAEDLRPLAAFGAEEVAHVLDDAEHRYRHLAEHAQALAGV